MRNIHLYWNLFSLLHNYDNDQIDVIIQRNHSQAFVLQWNGKKEREKKKNLIIEQKVCDKKKSGIFGTQYSYDFGYLYTLTR